MSAASIWNALHWTRFSQPRHDRALFQRVQKVKPVRIVELGIGDTTRATRVIRLAQRFTSETIQYCGIDQFDARATDGLPLKGAHQILSKTGAKVRLVPGDIMSALGRTANILTNTDLLIFDASNEQADIEKAFHFLPRMLHEKTAIARYDVAEKSVRLRWLKPSGFMQPARRAA